MKSYLLITLSFLMLIFSSCSDKKEDDKKLMYALSEGLANSTKALQSENEKKYYAIKEKSEDPPQRAHVLMWLPKVDTVRILSKELLDSIDHIRKALNAGNKFTERQNLYNKIEAYKVALFNIDKILKIDYREKILSFYADSLIIAKFISSKDTSRENALIILNKIENNIVLIENFTLLFFDMQLSSCGMSMHFFSPQVRQNTKHLKTGEYLEITVGAGNYNNEGTPHIIVDKNAIKLDSYSTQRYKIKAVGNPGKYIFPITVKYLLDDGTPETSTLNVEYFIDK
ncbi:MAG: hypothetical protein HY305_03100 [Sphingobacteriales bacterium]|nr:hypothetical protein [Sphingobacteriales bacterium]